MRDIALVLVMAGLLPFAIRQAWVAVLLWTWLSLMNPHRLAYGFVYDAPLAMIAAIAAALALVVGRDKPRLPMIPLVLMLLLFDVWMMFTTVFALYPAEAGSELLRVLKIQLMTMVAFAAIRERRHIEWFVWINVLSIGFYGLKGGLFTLLTGGGARVWGPTASYIEGNNEIGLALVVTIPLINYLRMQARQRWLRLSLLALMILSATAVLGTQSRGALLAIVAMALLMWWRSPRRLLGGAATVVAAVLLVTFMPETWVERMNTISDYEQDGSALGRFDAWRMALGLANDRLTGGSFGIQTQELFNVYAGGAQARAAHSIYFQVLGEHGWIGLLLFMAIGAIGFAMAGRLRRSSRQRSDAKWVQDLSGMVQVSMVGYAVGGAFLSLAYFDLPYNLLVMLVAMSQWMRQPAPAPSGAAQPMMSSHAGHVPGSA